MAINDYSNVVTVLSKSSFDLCCPLTFFLLSADRCEHVHLAPFVPFPLWRDERERHFREGPINFVELEHVADILPYRNSIGPQPHTNPNGHPGLTSF